MYTVLLRQFALLLFFTTYNSNAHPTGKTCKIPNAEAGTCTVLNKCDPLYELDKRRPKTSEDDAFFRQSVASCGRRSKLEVCCPPTSQWGKLVLRPVVYRETPMARTNEIVPSVNDSIDNRIPDPLPLPLTLNKPVKSKENQIQAELKKWNEQTSESCGVDVNGGQRIIGGNATEIDEYPWLALLEYDPRQFKCGGSLISRIHILTAAHCLYTSPSKVRLSEYNITSEPTDEVDVYGNGKDYITVTIVDVDSTTTHPDHVFKTSINDIGLVKMKKKVDYGDFIKPICLPTMDYRNSFFTDGTRFLVAGWGSDNVYVNSEVKRSVSVPYVTIDICMEMYGGLRDEQLICAGGEQGKDSCRGDSGGPLMYEDTSSSIYVLAGIVSSGSITCGAKNRPAIYTYVYHYVDWIKKTTGNNGND